MAWVLLTNQYGKEPKGGGYERQELKDLKKDETSNLYVFTIPAGFTVTHWNLALHKDSSHKLKAFSNYLGTYYPFVSEGAFELSLHGDPLGGSSAAYGLGPSKDLSLLKPKVDEEALF